MNKPNFANDFESLPERRSRVKAALADDQPADKGHDVGDVKAIGSRSQPKSSDLQHSTRSLGREWSSNKSGLNTRIPEDMKRLLDDLVWARGREATANGKPKPQIQDIIAEAIGDLLGKHEALLARYDLL